MSKFAEDIKARLGQINEMIRHASTTERRKLQRERSYLEEKLRKVVA